jgi:hypothetical protein
MDGATFFQSSPTEDTMQHLASLSQTALAALPTKVRPEIVHGASLSSTITRTLWVRMAEIYGHRWTSSYGESSDANGAAGTWAKGLSGIDSMQIAAGLKSCIVSANPWPPTLPEFRAMCLGIPTLAEMRLDSDKAKPFTILVWQRLDGFRHKMANAEQADRMLRDAYEVAREHIMRGGDLPELSAAVLTSPVKPSSPVRSPEVAAKALDELAALFGEVRKPAVP